MKIVLCILLLGAFAFAHPGGVSKDGCHYFHCNTEVKKAKAKLLGYTCEMRHSSRGKTEECEPPRDPLVLKREKELGLKK